jgi:hypothetical protein
MRGSLPGSSRWISFVSKYQDKPLDLFVRDVGGAAVLAGYLEPAFLQDPDGGDVMFGDSGVNGRTFTRRRNADSAAVATPLPQYLLPIQ